MLIPRRLRRILHYLVVSSGLLCLLIIGLAVSGKIELPADAVAIWGLALPVLVGGLLAGFIGPLVPGFLMFAFPRFDVGDQVIIGPREGPAAQGEVLAIDLYLTHLSGKNGDHVTVANQIIHGLAVTRL